MSSCYSRLASIAVGQGRGLGLRCGRGSRFRPGEGIGHAVAGADPSSCDRVEGDSKLLAYADGDSLRHEILFIALAGGLQASRRGRTKVIGLAQALRDRFTVTRRKTWICG